jgi:hypothetical protein
MIPGAGRIIAADFLRVGFHQKLFGKLHVQARGKPFTVHRSRRVS